MHGKPAKFMYPEPYNRLLRGFAGLPGRSLRNEGCEATLRYPHFVVQQRNASRLHATRDTTGFTQSKVAVVHPLDLFAVLEQRGYVYDEIAV
jgi:hypothetical protein